MAALAGDLLAVASSACFALSNITVSRGAGGAGEDNGAFASLFITTALAGSAWLVAGALHGFQPVTPRALAWFAAAGVFTAFVGRVFFYATIQHLGSMRSSATKRLIPFFAVMLGVGVLGEHLTGGMIAGMALIVASFGLLVWAARRHSQKGETAGKRGLNAGYVYGPLSALGYATGYLLRKLGLADAHDALLGAAVGCMAGIGMFLATATFNSGYAKAVRAIVRRPNPWLVAAGVLASCGQILYFAALNVNSMARVALVSSVEVFITLFLAAIFLRRQEALTPPLIGAAVLGFGGAACVVGW